MRLHRLELFGFKSFADRKVLEFAHAFTGIVGPNGCGKSNVVDAIRWVLGEQRPSSLRGEEMADVIFKGSASRGPMAVAEVTMVLDNRSDTLAARGAEVHITRRVYKGGEGEYLIDGERVRLKDVRDLLYGTGLGSRGYSVLEQGKIDSVLSANPLDRRAIFEEAAGISRYRARRRETEARLARVEADLVRLDDVVGELETRQRSLKIQAGRARRFLEARDAWRVDGLSLARHQAHRLEREVGEIRAALAAGEECLAAHRARRAAAEEDVAAREREQAALAGEVERGTAESADLAGEVRARDERRTQLLARVAAWETSAADEGRRTAELARRGEERRRERDELGRRLAALETDADAAGTRERDLGAALRDVRSACREARAASEAENERVLGLLHARTSARNKIEHLAEALAPLGERLRRAADREADAQDQAAEAKSTEEAARAALEGAEEELARHEAERATAAAADLVAAERERALEERHGALELEAARLQSRAEALLDWQREREKLEEGARRVLEAGEAGEGPPLRSAIAGLLADHLRTDTRHARALDAVLGLRAQALVVGGAPDALAILSWLKERQEGRVHLVLSTGLLGAEPPAIPAALRTAPGVVGPLLDAVRADESFAALGRTLLGDVVLVADLARAVELSALHPTLRFATEDGDVVDAGGLAGGHTETVQGAVGRRSFAAELEVRRVAAMTELLGVRTALEEARDAAAAARADLADRGGRIARAAAARLEARGALETARARGADLEGALALARHAAAEVDGERRRTEEELAAARRLGAELEERFELASAALGRAEERRAALETEVETLGREESEARVEAAGVGERREAARARGAELARVETDLQAELERARELAADHAANAARGREEAEALAAQRTAILAQRGELEERLAELRRREREGRGAIEELGRRREAITAELEALLGELAERRLEEQRRALALDEVRRRAEADFGIAAAALLDDLAPVEELAAPGALEALAAAVAELRERMDKLGPVNVEAVAELEGVTSRLDFLLAQRRDLAEARRSLAGTIERLNEESRRLFESTFAAVRGEFHAIFRQLFGGGKADIALVGDDDVLEAGVEISARPPGRETLPISALSGGQRTLTALALLFAVFRTRPSPFCVLDEVDAALDEANISRFLSLLKGALRDTQFVVVTHNKGTMAASDVLYGITMAVRGVSHVVSVELADVDEVVPDATGSLAAGLALEPAPAPGSPGGNGGLDEVPSAADGGPAGEEAAEDLPVVELQPFAPAVPAASG
ncbi:MAG: chromosome segregation protein SMC [Planctomycetota bacterium]